MPLMQRPIITLTTDFGTEDGYVGAMKGVLLSLCPEAQIVDITHQVPPQDIIAATFLLPSFTAYFPPGTIHIVVVDPGVGSIRRALAIETPQARFVGPDNGIFGLIWKDAHRRWPASTHAVELTERRFWRDEVSPTFHGRDIFAPVAAHLACGVELHKLGPPLASIVSVPLPEPIWTDNTAILGQIVYIDHFGNCMSNITAEDLAQLGPLQEVHVRVGNQDLVGIKHTYADVELNNPLALVGSSHYLEIALRNGHASRALGILPGEVVRVERMNNMSGLITSSKTSVTEEPSGEEATPSSRGQILVVDDDEAICQSLKALLELEGYSTDTVHNGVQAIHLLNAQYRYDVLITDLAMPDMDGLALIKHCRETELDVPVIIMTGYGSLETAVRALRLGAYDYVLKPFEPLVLLAAVARAVERQHLRREVEQRRNLETITRIALTVRHEINNPLAAIMGLAQLHLDEPLDADLHRDLETISKSAQRISEALQRLTHLRRVTFTDSGIGDGSALLALEDEHNRGKIHE